MIRLVDVAKSYPSRGGRKTVLTGVTIDFPPGRNTGIVGNNGAGKSTLLRLLSGAEMPDRGTIERRAEVSWPLGFSGGLHGSLTGRENVAFIARIYGRDYRETLDFVEDFADIGANMGNEVKTYSAGMRARVAFGMSMAIQFDYYLIDEVIAVGDAAFRKKSLEVFRTRLARSTIIVVSHSPALMKEYCDHGCLLRDGRLLRFDTVDEALADHRRHTG